MYPGFIRPFPAGFVTCRPVPCRHRFPPRLVRSEMQRPDIYLFPCPRCPCLEADGRGFYSSSRNTRDFSRGIRGQKFSTETRFIVGTIPR